MKNFFGSMNLARAIILLALLGSLVLLWFGWRHHSQLAELRQNLDKDVEKLSTQMTELARKHAMLSESLRGENLQGEANLQSYIYKIGGMEKVEVGGLDLSASAPDPFTKGVFDKKITIKPDNRERTFRRTSIANFLFKLEQESRRVKVTSVKIDAADKRLKSHEIPEDLWTFEAEVTSRQRSEP